MAGMNTWRARCGESRTSGSEGGPGKRIGREADNAPWSDPHFYALEDATECWLLNPRHMHNVPGRKTDMADADWICGLVRFGLVRPSFVPPQPVRELRNLTRYRRTRVEERTREAQRLDKVLQDAGVKLSSVASDILGRSGRAMLEALVGGSTDAEAMADLARGRLRPKIPLLVSALTGRFGPNHALVVGEILAHLDYLDESIVRIQAGIDELMLPFAKERERLVTIPGVDKVVAEAIVGEIGVDMSRFPSAAHLASWAGMCPGQHESAGKRQPPPAGGRAGHRPHRRPAPAQPRPPRLPGATAGRRPGGASLALRAQQRRLPAGGGRRPRAGPSASRRRSAAGPAPGQCRPRCGGPPGRPLPRGARPPAGGGAGRAAPARRRAAGASRRRPDRLPGPPARPGARPAGGAWLRRGGPSPRRASGWPGCTTSATRQA